MTPRGWAFPYSIDAKPVAGHVDLFVLRFHGWIAHRADTPSAVHDPACHRVTLTPVDIEKGRIVFR